MIDPGITKEIFVSSFTGAFLAILSAGVVWFIKSAYEKHRAEKFALAKFERIFALNLTALSDNFDFVNEWLEALENNRPYSFQLRDYILNEEDTYKISNLSLINKILSLNYKLNSLSLDLNNMYKNYWEVISKIDSIQNEQQKMKELQIYHGTIRGHLIQIRQSYDPVKNNIIELVATIRVAADVRFHSLFGYLNVFLMDIFPTVNEMAIKVEIEALEKQINERLAMRAETAKSS